MIDKIKIKDFLGTSINRVNIAQLTDKVNEIIQEINTESPATYKVYRAIINQPAPSEISANVLENSIGDIVWSYVDTGNYLGTLVGAFTENKTFVMLTMGSGNVCIFNAGAINSDEISIASNNTTDLNPLDIDGSFYLEIRVYI